MSAWSARYVRIGDRAVDVPRVRASVDAGATLIDDGTSPFVAWLVPNVKDEPADLAALSRDHGEAIAVTVQTIADLFVYDRFVAGSRVRGVTYAGEAGWERAVGEPDAWEQAALFAPTKLEELTLELEEDLAGEELARERAELAALWKDARLKEGLTRPPVDLAVAVRAIERHFKLPARPKS